MSAETVLADAIGDACDVVSSFPYRPQNLTARTAFVAPADVWKQRDEDSFCDLSVGLDVYLVAGSADFVDSFNWLDEQTTIIMGLSPVDVGGDQIEATEVQAPFVFTNGSGTSLLTARVTYSRFRS